LGELEKNRGKKSGTTKESGDMVGIKSGEVTEKGGKAREVD